MSTRVLVALWTLALLLAAGATVLIVTSDHEDSQWASLALALPVGLAFVAAGLIAWSRRPDNRTGILMAAIGFTWFIGALSESNYSFVFSLGIAFGSVVYGFFVWLVLAFPSGKLETRFDRILVALTFLLATLGSISFMLVDDLRDELGAEIPENAFLVSRNETIARAHQLGTAGLIFALTTAVVVVLAMRWLRATKPLRRTLTPVYLTSGAAIGLSALAIPLEGVIEGAEEVLEIPILIALVTVPLGFLSGLLRTRLARTGAGRMLLEIPDDPSPTEIQEVLRRTLGDPTLRLALWLRGSESYVDVEGRPLDLPPESATSATTPIEYEDRPVGALIHDPMLRDDPALLAEVVATIRVATERDQSLQALRASEQRTRALLDAIPDLMFRIRRDGVYLDFKADTERDLLSPEVLGRTVYDRLPEELAAQVMSCAAVALADGSLQTVEYALDFEGESRHYEGRIVASGEDEFLLMVREITVQQRLRDELGARLEELRIERDLVRTVVDTAPALLCGVDPDGRIIRFNRALERLSGHIDQGPVTDRPFWDVFVVPGEAREVERRFRRAITGSADGEFENAVRTHDGKEAVILWSVNWYPGERGEARYLITGTDITRRKRAEAELHLLAEEQAALRRVATLVASEAQPEEIFQLATEEAARVAGAQSSGMVRFESRSGRVVGRWHGGGPPGFEIGSVVPLVGDTSLPKVFRTGRPARVQTYDKTPGEIGQAMQTMGFQSSVAAPITVGGRLWGALIVATTSDKPLADDTERRLGDFAELVALALASADAREELIVSRARIVEAGDAARRKLERNLHDGAQQRLVVLSITLRLVQSKLKTAPREAEPLLAEAAEQLTQALEDLRELARGIHPAVLSDRGLEPALRALASRSLIPVEIEAVAERLPEPVEAAAYYVISEALTNATKYAQASEVNVRVACNNGHAVVEITDDGVGGADPTAGSGLRGLADRVAALDGRLQVASERGRGTRIRAEIPFEPSETAVAQRTS